MLMKTTNIAALDSRLAARVLELSRSLAGRNQIAVERSADDFDAAVLAAERESSAQTLSHDLDLLRKVEAARERLRQGTYGLCAACEEEISPKRLQAIPWAENCISCQARAESAPEFARAA
jgi:DnaK suppressor protein